MASSLFAKQCDRCGTSQRGLMLYVCSDCKRSVCSRCWKNQHFEALCLDCLNARYADMVRSIIARWGNTCPICASMGTLRITNFFFFRNPPPMNGPSLAPLMYNCVLTCASCQNVINERSIWALTSAHRAERAGRYEDAARWYEQVNLLDKARTLRERNRASTVRTVTIDVNALVEQLKAGGLSIPYKCTNCGATMTFDSNTGGGGLRVCSYCGATINTEVLSDLIKQALI